MIQYLLFNPANLPQCTVKKRKNVFEKNFERKKDQNMFLKKRKKKRRKKNLKKLKNLKHDEDIKLDKTPKMFRTTFWFLLQHPVYV